MKPIPTRFPFAACALLLITSLAALPAHADDKPGANKALRRLQMEVSKAQQEKAAVEAEKAELASKLEKASADVKKGESAQKQAHSLGVEVLSLRKAFEDEKARNEALQKQDAAHLDEAKGYLADTVKQANERFAQYETEIATLRKRVAESEAHGRELEHAVQLLETDKTQLGSQLNERGETLAACEKKNGELFALNADLRKRYADKGLLSVLRGAEPLTGLARVKDENALQDIEDKAYEAQVRPTAR
ncbi:MAG: hypothetical protein KGI67_14825 [Pseudomonadota bacterium]|nr:hypothetical protein [Pseudomonadota bacterium]